MKASTPPKTPKPAPQGAKVASIRPKVDWDAVKRDYRTNKFTDTELASRHNITRESISRKRKAEGLQEWPKDLGEAIKQATDAALVQSLVTQSHAHVTETVAIAAELNKNVILGHRTGLNRIASIKSKLLDQIEQAVPGYAEIGEAREGGTEGEYSAILYARERFRADASGTFWLSSTPERVSNDWGNANIRVCTWGRFADTKTGQAFYLFNTHLDHVSQPSRDKGVRLIVRRIQARAHPDPFVLTGDLNAGEDNPAIRYLKGVETNEGVAPITLIDTFRLLHPDAAHVGTFHSFKGTTAGPKIDFILTPASTHVLEATILHTNRDGRYPSDHFPVTARLGFHQADTPGRGS